MANPVDREGSFRANIVGYGLKEMESGAISVAIRAHLIEWWDGAEWVAWADYDQEAEGDIWIVKKDNGGLNSNGVESLAKHAGWDGNMESLVNETWTPTPCQVVVKRDEYKGNTRMKISFINAHDRTPGQLSNVDGAKAKELQTRFGGQLRAIVGNAGRNTVPPTPSTRPAAPPLRPSTHPATVPDNSSKIPF